MASKKQFGGLWGDEDSAAKGAKGSAATNLSGSRFSTRDYAVDQSVNLMALGEEPGTNLSGGAAPSTGGGLASSVAGLFRAKTGTEAPPFNEYGDAAPSTESEEYISDKQRRMTPVVASLRNFMATKAFFSLMLGVLGCGLLGGGIYLAATNIKDDGGATQAQMKQSIIDAGVTSKAVFNAGSSTAQSKALKWLAHDDPAKLAPEDKGFLDRYILATFYFGSNDKLEGWNKNENWMTGKGICSWAGVECVPKSVQPSNSNGFQSEVKSYDANDAITALKLPGNNMEGVIAEEFAGCKNLLILDLSENEISGSIPTQLGEMPKIRDLILHKNTIFGTFPSELTKLKGLHQLLLADNKMEGSLPYAIQNMLNLRTLSLSANSFEGAFPLLKPLKLLANLHLDDNQFRGTLADDLTALTELSKFVPYPLLQCWEQGGTVANAFLSFLIQRTCASAITNLRESFLPRSIHYENWRFSVWITTNLLELSQIGSVALRALQIYNCTAISLLDLFLSLFGIWTV
jgi:hypothetical protein